MSYAKVTKDNIPAGEMPEPSQEFLDGSLSNDDEGAGGKLNVISADEAEALESGEENVREGAKKAEEGVKEGAKKAEKKAKGSDRSADEKDWDKTKAEAEKDWEKTKDDWDKTKDVAEKKVSDAADAAERKAKEASRRAKAELDEAGTAVSAWWIKTKDIVLRPGTLGGLMGVVNVGILGSMGYWAYQNQNRPWDNRQVSAAVAGTLALFGLEGFVADSYLETPEGRAEAERAKREGSRLYLQAKEVILRPNVAGGLAGIFNIAVLGTVGFFAYRDWNRPWDHRTVAGVTAGLLALSGIEGFLGSQYVEKELPKH